jgi:hypothetical protein
VILEGFLFLRGAYEIVSADSRLAWVCQNASFLESQSSGQAIAAGPDTVSAIPRVPRVHVSSQHNVTGTGLNSSHTPIKQTVSIGLDLTTGSH